MQFHFFYYKGFLYVVIRTKSSFYLGAFRQPGSFLLRLSGSDLHSILRNIGSAKQFLAKPEISHFALPTPSKALKPKKRAEKCKREAHGLAFLARAHHKAGILEPYQKKKGSFLPNCKRVEWLKSAIVPYTASILSSKRRNDSGWVTL